MMKKKSLWLLLLPIILMAATCDSSKKTTSTPTNPNEEPVTDVPTNSEEKVSMLVNFTSTDDINTALAKAKKLNKVLFIDFYTTWCAPCKIMEQSVFRDEDVANYMNENCISIRVNAEKGKGPDRKLEYAIDAYPTMLVYTPAGDEIARKQGSLGIEAFKQFIKAAVWKAKNPSGKP
jgi:thiol:disulfide interchange protein